MGFGGMGVEAQPIKFSEIESFIKLMKTELLPSEIEVLLSLDNQYLKELNDGLSKPTNKH